MKQSMVFVSLIICILITGCGPGEMFGPTVTPQPTNTPLPTSTPVSTTGTITGIVTNSNGPLKGVTVKLFQNRNLITEKSTDAEGLFLFENVAPGKYVLNYDYFPQGGFTIHFQGTEFQLKAGETSQQDYVISN